MLKVQKEGSAVLVFHDCPRCGGTKLSMDDKSSTIRCNRCGLEYSTPSLVDLESEWNRTKEDRVRYVVNNLRNYGNAYIGQFTQSLWGESELAEYLQKLTGKEVKISAATEVEGGLVVKEVKAKREVA